MTKITEEDVKVALWQYYNGNDSKVDLALEKIGLKTPTIDEVVKAWEDVYDNQPGLEFNTNQPFRLEVNFRVGPTHRLTKRLAVVDLRSDYIEQGNTSIKYHHAINLTIRYLEAQKEKENE
jgi:hypothetical protein